MDCPGKMEIPGLILHPCKKQVCSCFLQVMHPQSGIFCPAPTDASHPPTPSFLNAPSPVLCEQPKSALDCRTASHCPHLEETHGRSPAPSGYKWTLHKSVLINLPRLCFPESFLPSSAPGQRAILRPPAPQPWGQPTSGRASVKVRDKKALAGSSRVHSS